MTGPDVFLFPIGLAMLIGSPFAAFWSGVAAFMFFVVGIVLVTLSGD